MLTLDELIQNNVTQSKIWLERMNQFDGGVQKFSSNFHYHHVLLAIKAISIGDYNNAKNDFFVAALTDVLQVSEFNARIFDYGLAHIGYALLSDCEKLIKAYAMLRYNKASNASLSMDDMVAEGELPIWCNTVQFFMVDDMAGVERNLNIIETKTLPNLSKNEEGLRDDYDFFKALHSRNKPKIEEVIDKLASPKIHKKRNDNVILKQYISLPALGYAKLAWRLGVEIAVDNLLVPQSLLPVNPLPDYSVSYNFLLKVADKL